MRDAQGWDTFLALFGPLGDAVDYVFARWSGPGSKDAMTRYSTNRGFLILDGAILQWTKAKAPRTLKTEYLCTEISKSREGRDTW